MDVDDMNQISRVLVINVARIGDTVLAVPVLRALKEAYPQARIDCIAHPNRAEVLEGLPFVERVIPMTKRSVLWRGWFGKKYDIALVFGRDRALLRYALRVANRVVAEMTGNPDVDRRLFAKVRAYNGEHAVHDRMRWLAPLGITPKSLRLAYAVSVAEHENALVTCTRLGILGKPLIGFQIGSFPTKAYRNWPVENFTELAERIFAHYPNAQILIFGDQNDAKLAQRLVERFGKRVVCLAGDLALRESVAMMSLLDLYVGVDTGPTHIAGALGLPMVSMYHCLHPGKNLAPLEHPAFLEVIELPGEDLCGEHRQMSEIRVERVWQAVENGLLAGK
jgi:heptosyltransferase-3